MPDTTLRIILINPDRLWQAGDMGMMKALEYRAKGRGLTLTWQSCIYGQRLDLSEADGMLIAGREISDPDAVMFDLSRMKGEAMTEAVADGMPMLATGAGFDACCRSFELPGQGEVEGLGIFPARTIPHRTRKGDALLWLADEEAADHRTETPPSFRDLTPDDAAHPQLVVASRIIQRRTVPEPEARPFARGLYLGRGINTPWFEGVRHMSSIGHHLQGEWLPLNPTLSDHFLDAMCRYKEIEPGMPMSTEAETRVRRFLLGRMLR